MPPERNTGVLAHPRANSIHSHLNSLQFIVLQALITPTNASFTNPLLFNKSSLWLEIVSQRLCVGL